jgi:hypothetical protein
MLAIMVACGSPHETVDASGPSRHDAAVPTGDFGAACTSHADCLSGYCVEALGGVGGVCSRTCEDDCPADWQCREVEINQAAIKLCVPIAPQLCLACATDTECGTDAACLTIDDTGSCATKCTTACPTGYTCADDASGMHAGKYCQPVIGTCTCGPGMDGASRACTNVNAIGTCYGTQTCADGTGWSACTAAAASLEACDGNDNDCDFLIDEDVGGGEACANTVPGVGTCAGVRACSGASGFICQGQIPTLEACNYADDDCDAKTDEAFPGVGNLCSPGVGACLRYGSIRCTADGTATECSVTAGSPTTELCNRIDDDCDTKTDETFTTLGTSCSAGLGVCQRFGTTVCSMDGTGTTCSVAAGTNSSAETCNYLDDNCDGAVDNGFLNSTTGLYDTTANCGACGNNCTTVFTGANSTGACSTASGSPQCVMICNAGTFDLNSSTVDGCEFALDNTSVYVSTAEPSAADDGTCGLGPTGTGAGNHPCRTIAFGLARASALARPNLRVADGTYDEPVTLVSNKSLFGGYRAGTWDRHLATTNTVIQGASTTGGVNDSTVTAVNVTNATFEGFVVRGSFNTKASGNSYAIYVVNGSASLVIRSNSIFAGRGGPGSTGTSGTNGLAGTAGAGSVSGSYNAFITSGSGMCNTTNNRQFTNGGVRMCGLTAVNGGNGGGNHCTPSPDNQVSAVNGFAGNSGGAGGGAGGASAQAGYDSELEISGQSSTCYLPVQPVTGADGPTGGQGANAAAVAGCSASAGSVVSNQWVNGNAVGGLLGFNGGGGAGGGAGGGGHCLTCASSAKDKLGAHGGGGGSGGCAGSGGGPGAGGGGVFGIFIVGGTAPTITSNAIQRGTGGIGGDGGIGGAGGLGGAGGDGGDGILCGGKAGRGGDGGNAGHGSGGGGGCGGSSYAIYTSGIGTPAYCSANTVSGGAGGGGGAGGFSGGNSGGNGAAGVLQGCTSI